MGISMMGSETTVREDGQSCREGELASTVPACHANCTRRAPDPRAAHAQTGVLCSPGTKTRWAGWLSPSAIRTRKRGAMPMGGGHRRKMSRGGHKGPTLHRDLVLGQDQEGREKWAGTGTQEKKRWQGSALGLRGTHRAPSS